MLLLLTTKYHFDAKPYRITLCSFVLLYFILIILGRRLASSSRIVPLPVFLDPSDCFVYVELVTANTA